MNLKILEEILIDAGVKPNLYSIGSPAKQSESYSLIEENGMWKILYKERGQFSEINSGLTESEACSNLIELFSDIINFNNERNNAP